MLLLTVVTFGLAAILTLGNISALGNFTMESCDELGERALDDSREALLERSREELLSLVTGQAMIANIQLDRLDDELSMLANLSGRYLLDTRNSDPIGNERRFLSAEKPEPLLSKSELSVYNNDSGEKYKNKLNRLGQIHPLLKFIYGNQRNMDSIYLTTTDGYDISYPWTPPKKGFSPYKREWYKKAVAADGGTVWVGPYISVNANKIIMTCAKAVKNFKGEIIAVCGIDVTVKEITQSFIGMKLVRSGRTFLIDKEGNILAQREMRSQGMQWYEDFKKENLFKHKSKILRQIASKMVLGEEGAEKINLPGEPELFVAYAPVSIIGWSIGVAVESSVLTASVSKVELAMKQNIEKHRVRIKDYFHKNLNIYLIMGGTVSIVVMLWGLLFSRRITAPILMLKKKALKIAKGDFHSNIHLHTGDELELLDKTFDRMTRDISHYMMHVGNTVREREKIEQEFAVAGNIQSFMLSPGFKNVPEAAIYAYMKPAHEVSGDFYNYFMVDKAHLFFCIGKVAGKGVPAAMLMAQVMTLLSHLGSMQVDPDKLLLTVNNTLFINNKTDMSVTAFCGFLNVASGELVFSNADHVPVVYVHDGDTGSLPTERTPALGTASVREDIFKRNSLRLSPGDILLFTTNGIDKIENGQGQVFEEEYLVNSFRGVKDSDSGIVKFALARLKDFYGSQISTIDIALLTVEYKGVDV